MKTLPKLTTVDTNNLQPGELIHTDFAFYNVTSICGFTSMITFVCTKTIMIWVLPTASKQPPFHIIHFIIKKSKEQTTSIQTCKSWLRWWLGKISRCHQPTCWWIQNLHGNYWRQCITDQRNNQQQNIIINNMVSEGFPDSNKHENRWWCAADTSAEVRIWKLHIELDNTSPHFDLYSQNPIIH